MKLIAEIGARKRDVEVTMRTGGAAVVLDGQKVALDAVEVQPGVFSIVWGGRSFHVRVEEAAECLRVYVAGQPRPHEVRLQDPRRRRRDAMLSPPGRRDISSPMPGKVVRVLVTEGQSVEAGQGLLVVEAMKMQNEIRSPKAGVVTRVSARAGAAVNAGETLAVVE